MFFNRFAALLNAGAAPENTKEARDEVRVRALEDMYDELKGVLQQCPGISEVRSSCVCLKQISK